MTKVEEILQSAYRISVIDETGKEVWNTGKVKSTESLGIQYAGESLRPSTRYQWHLTVWNQKNEELQASSAFETALVLGTDYNHPVATAGKGTYLAWEGAKWIGRGNAPVMFYAPYFPTFRLHYELQLDKKSKSTAASFIFGANDPRLMDRNKNLLGVSNAKDSSYIRVELDIAPLRKSKPARINFYRPGLQGWRDGCRTFGFSRYSCCGYQQAEPVCCPSDRYFDGYRCGYSLPGWKGNCW